MPDERPGFNQEEIDALMEGADSAAAREEESASADDSPPGDHAPVDAPSAPGEAAAPDAADPTGSGTVDQASIDALFGDTAASTESEAEAEAKPDEPDTRTDTLGRPFDESAAAMQAAIEEERLAAAASQDEAPAAPAAHTEPPLDLKAMELETLDGSSLTKDEIKRVTMLSDVSLRVKLQLGRTRMLVEDVLKLGDGSVVELDKLAGDPVDVLVNDRLIARGEVLILNDNFCVRINEVLANDPHRITA